MPVEMKVCFDRMTPMPKAGPMSRPEAARLVATLRESEVRKSRCGQRMIKTYEKLRKSL